MSVREFKKQFITKNQRIIIDTMKDYKEHKLKDLVKLSGLNINNVVACLNKMKEGGAIRRTAWGHYQLIKKARL